MNLGTAIFLSAVLLSSVALFIATKDRWNWKRIALWGLAPVIGVPLVGALGLYAYSYYSDMSRSQTVFWDIPLDATESDIKFLKGAPIEVLDKDRWVYRPENSTSPETKSQHIVAFRDGKIWYVMYFGSRSAFAPSLQRIRYGSSLQEVTEKFGGPSYVSISEDALDRLLSFEHYNVEGCRWYRKGTLGLISIQNQRRTQLTLSSAGRILA